jgi:hypothetical protein
MWTLVCTNLFFDLDRLRSIEVSPMSYLEIIVLFCPGFVAQL